MMKFYAAYWQAYLAAWKKYFVYQTRSTRLEYWSFAFTNIVIYLGLLLIGLINQVDSFSVSEDISYFSFYKFNYGFNAADIFSLVTFIPAITAAIRRLHDTNRRGWWLLIVFIPIVGPIILIYFLIKPSDKQKNRFGPPPTNSSDPYLGAS